jgi:hypothetical protein
MFMMFMISLLYFLNILKNLENFIKIGDQEIYCMNFRETPGKIGRVGMSEGVSRMPKSRVGKFLKLESLK